MWPRFAFSDQFFDNLAGIKSILKVEPGVLTLIGMSYESKKKCSSLDPRRNKFYKTQWAWQGVRLTQLISIFASIFFEFFDKNSTDKIQSKKDKVIDIIGK